MEWNMVDWTSAAKYAPQIEFNECKNPKKLMIRCTKKQIERERGRASEKQNKMQMNMHGRLMEFKSGIQCLKNVIDTRCRCMGIGHGNSGYRLILIGYKDYKRWQYRIQFYIKANKNGS